MRLVIDTNVFVSALIRPGRSLTALIDHVDQHGTLLYSTETLAELVDVLSRRKFGAYTNPDQIAQFVEWFIMTGELVAVTEPQKGSRDPKDDKFLSLAIAGKADYLISGDKDLLVLRRFDSVPIVSPAAFLALINA
jgi:putative PIN family toxin of toxin-antitoxin system